MDYPGQLHTVPYSNTALCPYCQRVIAVMPIPGRVNSADALGVTGLFRFDCFNCSLISSSPFALPFWILLFGFLTRSPSITFIPLLQLNLDTNPSCPHWPRSNHDGFHLLHLLPSRGALHGFFVDGLARQLPRSCPLCFGFRCSFPRFSH